MNFGQSESYGFDFNNLKIVQAHSQKSLLTIHGPFLTLQ